MTEKFIELDKNLSEAANELLLQQKETWNLCKTNYEMLNGVQVKEIPFNGFTIKVQFNPGRIISSSAKVDTKSIQERKCFLCPANLPAEQKGIKLEDDFILLVNPFPIFHKHFTIPKSDHVPQRILENFGSMLKISKQLDGEFTIFYNGPKCGASAPDHMHFQAGEKKFMPLSEEFSQIKKDYSVELHISDGITKVYAIDDTLRRFISLQGSNEDSLIEKFEKVYRSIEMVCNAEEEPMMNVLVNYDDVKGFEVLIFPRQKHRSSHYFDESENNILLSAASVDLGGVCITPLEKDFNKLDKKLLQEIFNEIMYPKDKFQKLL